MLSFVIQVCVASWDLLQDSALYILLGLVVGGMLKVFLSPTYVSRHLGKGRFSSVVKAALLGIPIPLCSCGVLPAAASLKKQGANNGATAAFLISTPESGVDSISISWALLDPVMTIARPISAFLTAFVAGVSENLFEVSFAQKSEALEADSTTCCQEETSENGGKRDLGIGKKINLGFRYAIIDLWDELAGWFFAGILLAGIITVLVPDDIIGRYLGGGLPSMLLMLVIGIPLYICATASTPIAAALLLKGVSPGAALVFLLTGPATNVTSLAVLVGLLGKRGTAIYLAAISVVSVLCGLIVDAFYLMSGISIVASVGEAGTVIPDTVLLISTIVLLGLSIHPFFRIFRSVFLSKSSGCGCDGSCESPPLVHLQHAGRAGQPETKLRQ